MEALWPCTLTGNAQIPLCAGSGNVDRIRHRRQERLAARRRNKVELLDRSIWQPKVEVLIDGLAAKIRQHADCRAKYSQNPATVPFKTVADYAHS